MQPTAEQLVMIERQLGRKPRGIAAIAYATEQGVPVVLQMRSLIDDKPFPTLYWLCSRDLYQMIAEIETGGWVKQIEQALADDEVLRQQYMQQQQAYVDLRWRLMDPEDRARIEALGFSDLYHRYGIGGIAQWDKVRCLHMQYAHHLVGDNLVGRKMDEVFGLNERLAELKL
ncbi:putative toxin to DivIC [Marinobacterium lacunae]|uniref:Putative toxin to DivIC n=1 Tax=Marinobacterium lacunae TaxID=1232683 RepID=A0A081FYI1_9GAMM|nr:DUF501 domain-containing protein [Marinobacterium lacunae]KEA63586.1 putative toxin to DivIC [Marinobacterium lacunae]MBR9884240.1 DUF501 domain-containing protein [Oceanospirillales bacterium]